MRLIDVEDLLTEGSKQLGLQPIVGLGGLGRPIFSARVQRPGRQLRDPSQLRANRLLIFGDVEIDLLQRLSPSGRKALFRGLSQLDLPCILVEGSLPLPEELRTFGQEHAIAVLGTDWSGPRLTKTLHRILGTILGDGCHIQGVLMRVYGVGVLILGRSGIGKSECALDLISRGHALVADDLVELHRNGGSGTVVGRSPELIRHHMEVRGLGIINIWELFGPEAVALDCPVGLVVELLEWDQCLDMDRTGLLQRKFTLLEMDIPMLKIPVSLNRNIAIILEVAVRNHLLQKRGVRSLDRLARRIESQLRVKARS
jgi:HPr kinase/phosphorylase